MGVERRGLLWRYWSELFVDMFACVDICLYHHASFAHHLISNQLEGEDMTDYEWDHVTSHSMQHS